MRHRIKDKNNWKKIKRKLRERKINKKILLHKTAKLFH